MAFDPVAQVKRYHEALNRYSAAEVEAFFAAGARYVSPGVGGAIVGREAIVKAFSAYFAEHPDQKAVDDAVETLDPLTVRALWRLSATSASTGRTYERRGIETVSFDVKGLIAKVEVEDR